MPLRIRHVDSLRAVAAGLVVWFHLAQTLGPVAGKDPALLDFLQALPPAMNLGRLGVMIFFAISGFVICRSFGGPREGGGRRFLIKRFCRLYPAFWVSMLGGIWACWLTAEVPTLPALAANATMAPGWLGQPRVLGVYWTLEIELLFYGACLGLYWAHCLERRAVLAGCAVLLAGLPRLVKMAGHTVGMHLSLDAGKCTLTLALAVMFWGAFFRLVYDETGGFRRAGTLTQAGPWLLALLTLAMIDVPDPNVKWILLGLRTGPWPSHLTVVYALVIFTVWIAWLRVDNPVMTYLGVISYSLYLFHSVVKYTIYQLIVSHRMISGWGLPFSVYLAVGVGLSVVLATAVYRWVERPAIALGKRWAGVRRDVAVALPGPP